MAFRIRVNVAGREIGYIKRASDGEVLTTTSMMRGTRFDNTSEGCLSMARAMVEFPPIERKDPKKPAPPVSFELIRS